MSLGFVLAAVVGPQSPASPSPSPEPSPAISAPANPQPGVASPGIPPSEPTLEDLYRSILPRPIGDPQALAKEDPGAQAPGTAGVSRDDGARDGLHLGRATLTPAFEALYVRAEAALLDTAVPVQDRYYEMRPQIGAEVLLGTGFLRGAYQARIRRGSSFEVVESTITHLADLSLDFPIGGVGEITGAEHFARGLLEAAEVDPGREYFFRLSRFTRHRHSLSLRLLPGGRADVTVGGSLDVVRVDDPAAFFDHDEQAVSAQLGYEVRPALRAALGYGYTRIPFTAERPEVESRMHSTFGELRGEILPLTTGYVSVGYSSQTSPNAGPGGTRFTGLTASGRLEKSFTPSSSLTVAVTRATNVSNFEQNAFYVTNAFDVLLHAGLPGSLALQAGAGYHRNDYRTVASSIGAPRRDEIRAWTLGLGRPVTRHAFVRADYRGDRRDSNIDAFDTHSNVLTVQLGVGLFAAPPR
jgi:putative beta-barrel porin BBP2